MTGSGPSGRGRSGPARLAVVLAAALAVWFGLAPGAPVVVAGAQPRRVVLVGDSIMLGAATQLEAGFRSLGYEVVVDAAVSRSTLAGAQVLAGHLSTPADAVVVMLGANDGGDLAAFRNRAEAVVSAAASVPHLFWMTIPEVRSYYPADNQVVRQVAAGRPGMEVLSWNDVTAADKSLTARDGLHLTQSGTGAMAFFVVANVESALSAPPTPSVVADGHALTFADGADDPDASATISAERTTEPSGTGGHSRWLLIGLSFGLVLSGLALVGLGISLWSLWRTRGTSQRS